MGAGEIYVLRARAVSSTSYNLAYHSYPARPDENFEQCWTRRMLNTNTCTCNAIVALLLYTFLAWKHYTWTPTTTTDSTHLTE